MDLNLLYTILRKVKKKSVNIACVAVVFIALCNIFFSIPITFRILGKLTTNRALRLSEALFIHKTLQLMLGMILLFLSIRLYKRMRIAWTMTIIILLGLIMLSNLKFLYDINILYAVEILTLFILGFNYKEFKRDSDPISFRYGLIFAVASIFFGIFNSLIACAVLKRRYFCIHSNIGEAIEKFFVFIFTMDFSVIRPLSKTAYFFAKYIFAINWACIIVSLFFILKPLIYDPVISAMDQSRTRELLNKYAFNPISYTSIEKDKKYYFGNNVEGVISYVRANNVAVCVGDPVCKEHDVLLLTSEFISYCKDNDMDICFCQTCKKYIGIFKKLGFGAIKYGEEAMFDLQSYSLEGKKASKIRQALHKAEREGIDVVEYKPQKSRDYAFEDEIEGVSKEWLSIKKSSELSFMLGSLSLENPLDRRYFVALDKDKHAIAFVVFVPFLGGKGFYADVTRRRESAPIGTMEKIIISAFNVMKEEGVEYGSLGLSPLVNAVESDSTKSFIPRVLQFIYENMNQFYGFKTLYQYKKKYGPSRWEPRYIVFYPKFFSPKIAYSIIKAHNPKGVKDYLFYQLKGLYKNQKAKNNLKE